MLNISVFGSEQRQVGNRRIEDQVVTAEDHRPPELPMENPAVADALEIFVQQGLRDRFGGFVVVGGGAAMVECLVVDVGRVHFDAFVEPFGPERFGQQHGQAVGFFAGRAPGAPDANRRVTLP